MSDFSLIASNKPQAGYGLARGLMALGDTFSITTGMLALNKTTDLLKVPAGFTLTGLIVIPSDMDTNGTPTLVLAIGDSGSATRVLSGFTGAQSGTANLSAVNPANILYQWTTETTLFMTATTAAATAVAGTLTVLLIGYIA